jgi:energy-coupling factor transporter transmembrane protein EcfT
MNIRDMNPRKTNDLLIFFIALIYIFPVFVSENLTLNFAIVVLALLNAVILRKIRFRYLIVFVLLLIPVQLSVFLTTALYSRGVESTPVVIEIFSVAVRRKALDNAVFITARTFILSVTSFIFLLGINFENLVTSLMQNLRLNPVIGFSILAAVNAFKYMKDEFVRIQTAYRMRSQNGKFFIFLFFPLMVSASRYAFYAALSMESRGLSEKRTFLKDLKWKTRDTIYLLFNILEMIFLVILLNYLYSSF